MIVTIVTNVFVGVWLCVPLKTFLLTVPLAIGRMFHLELKHQTSKGGQLLSYRREQPVLCVFSVFLAARLPNMFLQLALGQQNQR